MEDFTGAYKERKDDAFALLALQNNHSIAAFHLGGIAIECYLKSLLISYHQLSDWKHKSLKQNDPLFDKPIKNPSHRLMEAIKNMSNLYNIAITDGVFLNHLSRIINPLGEDSPDYISLRYSSEAIDSTEEWLQSFNYVLGWLDQNKGAI